MDSKTWLTVNRSSHFPTSCRPYSIKAVMSPSWKNTFPQCLTHAMITLKGDKFIPSVVTNFGNVIEKSLIGMLKNKELDAHQ
ncbi:MAG: hypothetical protein COB61_004760 [Thiotrichales bacterium]|nr:hypothetical protein [Thiotrichales bacterium]